MDSFPPPVPQTKNSGLAIWSLVLGVLGVVLFCAGPLFGIPAVICGHMAYGRIKRSGGALDGQGLATAGLITGYISIAMAVFVIPLLAAIAIPNFVKARNTAQRNACINNLRMIDGAKQQWALENGKTGDAVPTEQDIAPYLKGDFGSLHCPANGTYTINRVADSPTCSIPEHSLAAARGSSSDYSPPQRSLPGMVIRPPRPSNSGAIGAQVRETHACEMQLQMIALAKRSWAQRYHKQPTDVPTADDIAPFLPGKRLRVCPGGGTYNLGAVNENPSCSISEHQFSGPPPPSVSGPFLPK